MANRYKIDVSDYVDTRFKYALYVKRAWWRRWEKLGSYERPEEAKAVHATLTSMPILL